MTLNWNVLIFFKYFVIGLVFLSIFFEPTDKRKATKPLINKNLIDFASPNIMELREMASIIDGSSLNTHHPDVISEVLHLSKIVCEHVRFLIVTLGAVGVMTVKYNKMHTDNRVCANLYPTTPLDHIENVSGAGDCFSSGFIYGMICQLNEQQCITVGFQAAKESLKSTKTVPCEFNISKVIEEAYYKKIS